MNTGYNSSTLKDLQIQETELKSSKLYQTVPDDKWKLYNEEKQKFTQELRKSGLLEQKNVSTKGLHNEGNIRDEFRNSNSNPRWYVHEECLTSAF